MTAPNRSDSGPGLGPGVGDPVDDPILEAVRAVRALPAVAIAAFTGGLVVMRLLTVADYRIDVALAMLTSAGVANVVIGSAVSVLPWVLPLATIAFFTLQRDYHRAGRRAVLSQTAAIWAGFFALLITPVVLLAIFIVGSVVQQLLMRRRQRQGPVSEPRSETLSGYAATMGVFGFIYLVSLTTPWLPPETIVSNGATTVGYVTDSDSRWTHVLTYQPRVVLIFETSAIAASRTTCTFAPTPLGATLRDLIGPRASLPECPAH
jgi:hypothetical protein